MALKLPKVPKTGGTYNPRGKRKYRFAEETPVFRKPLIMREKQELLAAWNDANATNTFAVDGLPGYDEIRARGIGAFLRMPLSLVSDAD